MPTRMLTLTPVTSRTSLQTHKGIVFPLQTTTLSTNKHRTLCKLYSYSRYGLDHVNAHLYTAVGVVSAGLRQSGNAIITITQDFNTQTVVFLRKGETIKDDRHKIKGQLKVSEEMSENTGCVLLTDASLSKRAKSSLSVMTSSWAVHCEARLVKPSISANRMLGAHTRSGNTGKTQ